MGKIGKGTKVWDEKGLWGDHEIGDGVKVGGLQFSTFSANCSSTFSVRNPILTRPLVLHRPEPRGRTDPRSGGEGELGAAARGIERCPTGPPR